MRIRRDPNGQPMTIGFNGSEHFYLYNAQGDVVAIANYSGEVVVEYTYDAWGNPLSCTGSLADTLGKKNPFRYRGYVYDEETGLYYLKSRYYDPRVGRFICADALVTSHLLGKNLFTYCGNNPIIYADPSGHDWAYHKLRQEYAQMGIPYPGTPGSHVPDSNYQFATEKDAVTHWAIVNRPLSKERERGALVYLDHSTGKYKLGETFVGNDHTVAGPFILNYVLSLRPPIYNFRDEVVALVHTHPQPKAGYHNDFPSYTTPELPIFHDMFLFNFPKIQEVYVVPYGPCEFAPGAVPSIIASSDVASWYDSHIQHGTPMYPMQ